MSGGFPSAWLCLLRVQSSVAIGVARSLDHHIKVEEHGIFEKLSEHFTDEQRDAMGADFVSRKRKLLPTDGPQVKKAE